MRLYLFFSKSNTETETDEYCNNGVLSSIVISDGIRYQIILFYIYKKIVTHTHARARARQNRRNILTDLIPLTSASVYMYIIKTYPFNSNKTGFLRINETMRRRTCSLPKNSEFNKKEEYRRNNENNGVCTLNANYICVLISRIFP